MSESQPWNVGRLLQWTTDYLKKREVDNPRLDAEILLAEALGCARIDLYTRFAEVPAEAPLSRFRELVRRRAERTPVAYLVGHREFYSLDFVVTPDVLIPRPETEYLVVRLLDGAKRMRPAKPPTIGVQAEAEGAEQTPKAPTGKPSESVEPLQIVDVGTGSGVIAICAAKHLPNAKIAAVDLSRAALAVAMGNAKRHDVANRIEFLPGDLLTPFPAGREFDIIASNPPYVAESDLEWMSDEVKRFEPRGALVSGPTGTEIIERLIAQAVDRLKGGGELLMELSPMIHDKVVALVNAEPALEYIETVKDLDRHPRILCARKREA